MSDEGETMTAEEKNGSVEPAAGGMAASANATVPSAGPLADYGTDDDLNPITTVGDLRKLIADVPDDRLVKVHHGWDLLIAESGFDEDGTVLLFVDDSHVATVSREWLDRFAP